jgi:hypothetical protein
MRENSANAASGLKMSEAEKVAAEIWSINCDANNRYNALPDDEDASIEASIIGSEAVKEIEERIQAAIVAARRKVIEDMRYVAALYWGDELPLSVADFMDDVGEEVNREETPGESNQACTE